jgi:hypothetical protein
VAGNELLHQQGNPAEQAEGGAAVELRRIPHHGHAGGDQPLAIEELRARRLEHAGKAEFRHGGIEIGARHSDQRPRYRDAGLRGQRHE